MIRRNLVNNLYKKRFVNLNTGDSIIIPSYHTVFIVMNSQLSAGGGEVSIDGTSITISMTGWANLYLSDKTCSGFYFNNGIGTVIQNNSISERKLTSNSDHVLVYIL